MHFLLGAGGEPVSARSSRAKRLHPGGGGKFERGQDFPVLGRKDMGHWVGEAVFLSLEIAA